MRELNITLEPFWTVDVVSCHIRKALNDHATLQFSGHIPVEAEEHYMRAGQSDVPVKLSPSPKNGHKKRRKNRMNREEIDNGG